MQISQIQVSAGRTFNHPYEQYSNFRPGITIVANLSEKDNPEQCAQELQRQAETFAEQQKQTILKDIEELRLIEKNMTRKAKLELQLQEIQHELEYLGEWDKSRKQGQLAHDDSEEDELPL